MQGKKIVAVRKSQNQVEFTDTQSLEIIRKYKSFQVSKFLDIFNGNGVYQQRVLLLMVVMVFSIATAQNNLTFIFLQPQLYCRNESDELEPCSRIQACKNPQDLIFSKNTFNSFVVQQELICDFNIVDLAQSAILFIAAFGSFILNIFQDMFGRTRIINICITIGIMSFLLIGFLEDQVSVIVGVAGSMLYFDSILSCFYSYFPEVMGPEIRNKTTGLILISLAVQGLSMTYFSSYFSSYQQISLIAFFLNFLGIIVIFYFVESPMFCYEKGDLLKLEKGLQFIRKQNIQENEGDSKVITESLFLPDLNLRDFRKFKIINSTKKYSLTSQEKKNLFNVLFIVVQMFLTVYVFVIAPQSVGFSNNIQTTLYFNYIGQILGQILTSYFSIQIPRKKFFSYLVYSNFIFALCLFIISFFKLNVCFKIQVIQILICLLLRIYLGAAFAMIFNYIAEMVRTQVRGFSIGLMVFAGRLSVSFLPHILNLQEHLEIHPFSFVMLFSFFNFFTIGNLPETKKSKIK